MADLKNDWRRAPPPAQLDIRPHFDGVFGRLTYGPAQGDQGIGELRTSRMKQDAPRFQQVTPFTQWFAPEKTDDLSSDLPPWRLLKSQKNWLRRYYPEACLVDPETETLLADEVKNYSRPEAQLPPATTSSLLAKGEVTDLRGVEVSVKGLSAVAFASGKSGHILRIISLSREEWSWESEDIRGDFRKPDLTVSGEWCQDSQPICLIRFAMDKTRFSPIRWLMIQKPTMTVVCEPEVKIVPTQTTGLPGGVSSAAQLSANPLFAIRSDHTGGSPQTNVSFKSFSDGHAPQLAIIDEAGQWSIWDIIGRRAARPKILRPVMKLRGNILRGPVEGISTKISQLQDQHNILWLSLDRDRGGFEMRDRSRSPSIMSEEPEAERPSLLLMCNSTVIHLFDVDTGRFLDATQKMVLYRPHTGSQKVLHVKRSPLHSSQAFILTSTMIFLVAAKETNTGKLSLDILAACPHRRDSKDPALRMHVSPTALVDTQRACFVCVRSPKDTQMAVAWFVNPEPGMPLRHYTEIVSLKEPPNFASMLWLRVNRRIAVGNQEQGLEFMKSHVKYFQLLALGEDLSLNTALCASSEKLGLKISHPDRLIRQKKTRLLRKRQRLKFLHVMENAFVVPDGYDERPWLAEAKGVDEPFTEGESSEPAVHRVANFKILGGRMAGKEDDIEIDREGAEPGTIAHAIERETREGVMPRHSLLDLVGPEKSVDVLFRVASEWRTKKDELVTGILRPAPSGIRISGTELDELVAKLEDMFIEPLKAEDPHIRETLRRMAAEIFLSEIGIAARPPVADTEMSDAGHLDVASQRSTNWRSSPPLEASQEEPDLPTQRRSEKPGEEAPVSIHLREYAYMKPVTTTKSQTMLQSHWDRGLEKGKIDWTPWKGEELDAAYVRRKKRAEKRRNKDEKLASRIHSEGPASTVIAESQPIPIIQIHTSQPREAASFAGHTSSQMPPTSQPVMSQIVSGPYGGRPQKKAKKKGKSGFR
ncbi:RNA polymerase I-specific transcription initiation factor RRN6-like protein [Cercophora newfieldiana]|uniref:RNA polymerase I-specific transcription initiation factor RRN6-like protein n=1 Tax=Cercophora newfieldiana TaxID=92897 RepID=A0AA39YHU9_9PEZI|nr:RNA polymerase I-specific transcription initiation factor RRN6-like protein [Cercophora newfieldiana]